MDSNLGALKRVTESVEESMGDMLSEYEKFCSGIARVLAMRHRMHVEFEAVSETLIGKQTHLERLETTEHESQRLAAIISSEGGPQVPMNRPGSFMSTLNAMIDNDPDTTRRVTISRTKDAIAGLEGAREERRIELLAMNVKVQRELDRFQKRKIR